VDGIDGVHTVVAGADEVGADAAVVGQGSQGVPVAGDGLMSFGVFEACPDPNPRAGRVDLLFCWWCSGG
jgi:hypothetical protein